MKAMIERITGTAAERAAQRLERASAELQRVEQELEALRQKRDRLLVEDALPGLIAATRKEVRALEAARADALEDLEAAQKAAERAKADTAAREREKRRKRRDQLFEQRLAAARELQAGIMSAAAAWNRMSELARELGGVLDTPRPTATLNEWHEGARAAAEGQLKALSGGALGDRDAFPSLRFNSYAEYLRKSRDLVATVELQHSRVVNAEPKAA